MKIKLNEAITKLSNIDRITKMETEDIYKDSEIIDYCYTVEEDLSNWVKPVTGDGIDDASSELNNSGYSLVFRTQGVLYADVQEGPRPTAGPKAQELVDKCLRKIRDYFERTQFNQEIEIYGQWEDYYYRFYVRAEYVYEE